jgi:ATP-dependent DNA helicase RecG
VARERTELQGFLEGLIRQGEDIGVEFKRAAIKARDLATPLVAMVNTYGGWILIGVENDGQVTGIGRRNIEPLLAAPTSHCQPISPPLPAVAVQVEDVFGEKILVFYVRPGSAVYSTRGVAYVRDFDRDGKPCNRPLSPDETARLALSKGQVTFESVPEKRASTGDLDVKLAAEYAARRRSGESWEQVLLEEGLLSLSDGQERLIPSNAAILLFGRNPTIFLGNCTIDLIRYEGIEQKVGTELNVIKRELFQGPLPQLLREAFEFVRTQVRERSPLVGLTFESAPEYPEMAWQEAVVNAVGHRDYGILGSPIFVRLFDDRMEIESPGRIVPPNTMEDLRAGKYIHCSRNPQIVRALKEMGFMRGFAEGIRRMTQEMERHDLSPPEFCEPNHSFRVTLFNAPVFPPDTQVWLKQFDGLSLSNPQRRALAQVHRSDRITNSEYRRINQTSRENAERDLRKLVELGILKLRGRGAGAHYVLSPRYARAVQLPLDPRQQQVLEYVARSGSITNAECRQLLNLSRTGAHKLLRQLVADGHLQLRGVRRGARYTLP